jgi:hypothetical protein
MAGCRNVNPIPPQELSDFGGFKICGKRGGDSFLGIQRPLDLNGTCPEGYKTCNPESLPEKRLCSLEYNLCPINEIKITNSGPEEPGWEYRSIVTKIEGR